MLSYVDQGCQAADLSVWKDWFKYLTELRIELKTVRIRYILFSINSPMQLKYFSNRLWIVVIALVFLTGCLDLEIWKVDFN